MNAYGSNHDLEKLLRQVYEKAMASGNLHAAVEAARGMAECRKLAEPAAEMPPPSGDKM